MYRLSIILIGAVLQHFAAAVLSPFTPNLVPRGPQVPLPNKIIHQFPLPTWIENVAVRSNNDLLLTLLTTPSLYTINPTTPAPAPKLIYNFPNVSSLFGITEVFPDKFVVVGGNFTLTTATSVPGTYAAWLVDFTPLLPQSIPRITKITNIPEAYSLNGMTKLSGSPGAVLIADSALGLVWKLNVLTGRYEVVIGGLVEMAASGSPQIGINGISVTQDSKFVYWTNSNTASLYRTRIAPSGVLYRGSRVEKLATDEVSMDDFAIDNERSLAWVATNFRNSVVAVKVEGPRTGRKVDVVGGIGELTVAGCTAAAFGRGKYQKLLYVVTGGALAAPVNGTLVEGGKVVVVDTKGFDL